MYITLKWAALPRTPAEIGFKKKKEHPTNEQEIQNSLGNFSYT